MNKDRELKKLIRDILSRKDPDGYYIVLASNTDKSKKILTKYLDEEIIVEEIGNILLIKCKARKLMEAITRELVSNKLLANV